MKSLQAFLKKETLEVWKNYHLIILLSLFTALGILSVFTAKFTPELISQLVSPEIGKALPEPTLVDSWLQFYKNVSQIGLFVVVILFSSSLTNEYQKGTLTILVTKGLPRWTVVTSKLLVSLAVFTTAFGLGAIITYLYSLFYFKGQSLSHVGWFLFLLWLFSLFMIVMLFFASVVCRNTYSVLLMLGSLVILLLLVSWLKVCQPYNPLQLFSQSTGLLTKDLVLKDFIKSIAVTSGLSLLMFISSLILFNRKSL